MCFLPQSKKEESCLPRVMCNQEKPLGSLRSLTKPWLSCSLSMIPERHALLYRHAAYSDKQGQILLLVRKHKNLAVFLTFTYQVCQSMFSSLPASGACDRILGWIPEWQSTELAYEARRLTWVSHFFSILLLPTWHEHLGSDSQVSGLVECGWPAWALGLDLGSLL